MAVKCNITGNVLNKIKAIQWGIAKDEAVNKAILRNYQDYLACPSFILKSCGDDIDCKEQLTILNCNINIVGMSFSLITSGSGAINFFLAIGDVYNAVQPLTYKWIVNPNDFTIIGSNTNPTVVLDLVGNKNVNSIVSPIIIEITDVNGCKDSKQCYYTPTGMKCNNSFHPCFNDKNLQVNSFFVTCARPKYLVVNNL